MKAQNEGEVFEFLQEVDSFEISDANWTEFHNFFSKPSYNICPSCNQTQRFYKRSPGYSLLLKIGSLPFDYRQLHVGMSKGRSAT
jgi:hypothetical protein